MSTVMVMKTSSLSVVMEMSTVTTVIEQMQE